jgi:hypothetical protein
MREPQDEGIQQPCQRYSKIGAYLVVRSKHPLVKEPVESQVLAGDVNHVDLSADSAFLYVIVRFVAVRQ